MVGKKDVLLTMVLFMGFAGISVDSTRLISLFAYFLGKIALR